MSENDMTEKCMVKCLNELKEKAICNIYVTEENMNTVLGKYWNNKGICEAELSDEELQELSQLMYLYCFDKNRCRK